MVASEQVLVTGPQLDTLCINTIRTLAIDAVQQVNSGHPGAPMGLSPVTYCLWQEFMRYDPAHPTPRTLRPPDMPLPSPPPAPRFGSRVLFWTGRTPGRFRRSSPFPCRTAC